MATPLIQPTFSGGELSPSLQARVDIERYGNSVKTGKNFIVRPYGGMVNRPGFKFVGEVKDSAEQTRLIPFVYSADIAYVIELGDLYARFIANGAYVLATTSNAYNAGTTYAVGDYVTSGGIVYRSLQGSNTGNTPASSPLWWEANPIAETVTPWPASVLSELKHTQSADVLYVVHPDYPPHTISRVGAGEFVAAEFEPREGPFRDVNANEALRVAASAFTGSVTITANADIFTADMVGQLLYMEAESLGQVKPWTQGDRGVSVGTLRRSDGKTYKATTVPSAPDWTECGSFRPVHQFGKEWDGPADSRTDGTRTWIVGIEWEYQDSGYGIIEITGFTNAKTLTGRVVRNLPTQVVGGFGTALNTWTFNGDGVTRVFSITGATQVSPRNYTVTINGSPVSDDTNYGPSYTRPGGGGNDGIDFQEP